MALYELTPRVAIFSESPDDPSASLSAPFTIRNDGRLPIHDVQMTCRLVVLRAGRVEITGAEFAGGVTFPVIRPQESATVGCDHTVAAPGQAMDADLIVTVTFQPSIVWWGGKGEARFVSRRTPSGYPWLPKPTHPR